MGKYALIYSKLGANVLVLPLQVAECVGMTLKLPTLPSHIPIGGVNMWYADPAP